jgi:hypothetical protein
VGFEPSLSEPMVLLASSPSMLHFSSHRGVDGQKVRALSLFQVTTGLPGGADGSTALPDHILSCLEGEGSPALELPGLLRKVQSPRLSLPESGPLGGRGQTSRSAEYCVSHYSQRPSV